MNDTTAQDRKSVDIPLVERDFETIVKEQAKKKHWLCMGLDPVWEKLPDRFRRPDIENPGVMFRAKAFLDFCKAIVDATYDLVAAYKPNAAFFEALGWEGEQALEELIAYIREKAPDVAIIIDAKRGDIDNTNNGYVAKFFGRYRLDAITVSPLLGKESLKSFLDCAGKGVIVLVKTSNEGSGEFQDRMMKLDDGEAEEFGLEPGTTHLPFYELIAHRLKSWQKDSAATICVVVGVTYPRHTAIIREILPNVIILQPGVGAQGGKLDDAVSNGVTAENDGILVNVGSKALYASSGDDFAERTRAEVVAMNEEAQQIVPTAA